jgi:mannose-6-phosphate isomerase-like protein (cupin superfamily)
MEVEMDHGRREPVILRPGQGRSYDCGSMRAVFKADGIETASRYSVSEWWLEQNSRGPGAHSHEDNDELFLVLEGEPSILVAETWHQFSPSSFLMIPARTVHDFENRTTTRAGLFNVFIPGGFEENMTGIVEWFRRSSHAR